MGDTFFTWSRVFSRIALREQQEEEDARLARQASINEEQAIRQRKQRDLQLSEIEVRRLEMEEKQKLEKKRREENLSEREARRLQILQKQALEQKQKEQVLSEAEARRLQQLQLGSSRAAGSPVHTQGGRWGLCNNIIFCAQQVRIFE